MVPKSRAFGWRRLWKTSRYLGLRMHNWWVGWFTANVSGRGWNGPNILNKKKLRINNRKSTILFEAKSKIFRFKLSTVENYIISVKSVFGENLEKSTKFYENVPHNWSQKENNSRWGFEASLPIALQHERQLTAEWWNEPAWIKSEISFKKLNKACAINLREG